MSSSTTLPSEAVAALPEGSELPDVFLGYQKRLMKLMATASVAIVEKSRRIGITWSIAADAVLVAATTKSAGGMDVFYIGFNLDMTKEFIDTSADWAKQFSYLASSVEEFMFQDQDEDGDTKEIQALPKSPTLDPLLYDGIQLTDKQKSDLLAFLNTLNDEEFIRDKRFHETN